MDADLDTLAAAVDVRVDDEVKMRPDVGLCPRLPDAALITMAVIEALLGSSSETRLLRLRARSSSTGFPTCRTSPGDQAAAGGGGPAAWPHPGAGRRDRVREDDTGILDSTPVECGRSRETGKRSELVGLAGAGCCARHSRGFWGLRLHLVTTPAGLAVTFALPTPRATSERCCATSRDRARPPRPAPRPGHPGRQGLASAELETFLAEHGATLIRPQMAGEAPVPVPGA